MGVRIVALIIRWIIDLLYEENFNSTRSQSRLQADEL